MSKGGVGPTGRSKIKIQSAASSTSSNPRIYMIDAESAVDCEQVEDRRMLRIRGCGGGGFLVERVLLCVSVRVYPYMWRPCFCACAHVCVCVLVRAPRCAVLLLLFVGLEWHPAPTHLAELPPCVVRYDRSGSTLSRPPLASPCSQSLHPSLSLLTSRRSLRCRRRSQEVWQFHRSAGVPLVPSACQAATLLSRIERC